MKKYPHYFQASSHKEPSVAALILETNHKIWDIRRRLLSISQQEMQALVQILVNNLDDISLLYYQQILKTDTDRQLVVANHYQAYAATLEKMMDNPFQARKIVDSYRSNTSENELKNQRMDGSFFDAATDAFLSLTFFTCGLTLLTSLVILSMAPALLPLGIAAAAAIGFAISAYCILNFDNPTPDEQLADSDKKAAENMEQIANFEEENSKLIFATA